MSGKCECAYCWDAFTANPRIKEQKYCGKKDCQRARRREWQREKMRKDPDYKDNQKRCQLEWVKDNKGYWKNYREKHPEYAKRNRVMQIMRNLKQKLKTTEKREIKTLAQDGRDSRVRSSWAGNRVINIIAKMDSLIKPIYSRKGGRFRIVPEGRFIAKMDAITAKLIPVQYVSRSNLR